MDIIKQPTWRTSTATRPCRRRFSQAFQTADADFRKLVADLLQSGYDSGEFKASADPQQVAPALVASRVALLLQAWLDPDFDPIEARRHHIRSIIIGGNFKTSPRTQYPRWAEASNPRNTQCMSAVGRFDPPSCPADLERGILSPIVEDPADFGRACPADL